MKCKLFQGVQWRIAIPYTVLLIVTMLGVWIYLSRFIRQIHLNNIETSLLSQSELIGDVVAQPLAEIGDDENLDDLARRLSELIQARVTIIRNDGLVLGESHENRTKMDNHLNRPEVQQSLIKGQGTSIRFSRTAGMDMFYTSVPVIVNGETVGFSRVALPLAQVEADIDKLRRSLLLFTLVLTAVSILLGFIIAGRTTRPIRNLNTAVSQMVEGNLNNQLMPRTGDEIGELTGSIENLATQLHEQLDTLKAEESKLSAVLAQMSDGVVMVDQEGEVVLINQKAAQLFEVNALEAIGSTVVRVLKHYQFVELWQGCLEDRQERSEIVELQQPRRFIQGVATILGGYLEGNSLLIFRDLTNVRRLETVRRDFISNISHELRTPLASLKALAETLQGGAINDPPAARHFVNQIELEVDTLNQMTSELLELARIESRETDIQLKPADSCNVMEQACDRLQLQAERAKLQLKIECPNDLPQIMADGARLEQVFVNLVHNAIKFTPPGGEIIVSAQKDNSAVRFAVMDNGTGIPAEDLPRIFERFYKTDKARSGSGTGLGLAIAKNLVEAHGGKIWAESIEEKGSTFFFVIPTAE
ncbi:MAG: ATP-binding protein [Anaerolineales bacterium]|jgi:two-component system phosphate regulon sensor histidine kinase PhoR